jgi:S1-C subfamily serine protease
MLMIAVAIVIALVMLLPTGHPTPPAAPTPLPSDLMVIVGGTRGSGVHLGDGAVLTASHVLDGATAALVKPEDGPHVPATLLWAAPDYDIALMRADAPLKAGIAELACREPILGEDIEIAGSPLDLGFVHTWGRVAGPIAERDDWKSAFIADVTNAWGMSGAPVFDRAGRVLGIDVGIAAKEFDKYHVGFVPLTYIVPSSAVCGLLARGVQK